MTLSKLINVIKTVTEHKINNGNNTPVHVLTAGETLNKKLITEQDDFNKARRNYTSKV